ncbi:MULTISPECIES: acyl carrier protein [unclassified Sporolactobacillus]|uniref:acyl carrier protein n=1 Tax=unclassified Sporolactobacillus TaxID=2628533 RepID=UPI0023688906|nr:acyl carrier protein [Sporolactobacillus sp. CQH2019]MDD9147734.1 acyl carrier protein [Sporolactobacillus sp. CQH2019]
MEKLTEQEIENRVKKVVAAQLQVDQDKIKKNSLFVDDLGADSLDLTELAIAFEDEFNLEIPEADFDEIATVSGVVAYLYKKLEEKGDR